MANLLGSCPFPTDDKTSLSLKRISYPRRCLNSYFGELALVVMSLEAEHGRPSLRHFWEIKHYWQSIVNTGIGNFRYSISKHAHTPHKFADLEWQRQIHAEMNLLNLELCTRKCQSISRSGHTSSTQYQLSQTRKSFVTLKKDSVVKKLPPKPRSHSCNQALSTQLPNYRRLPLLLLQALVDL